MDKLIRWARNHYYLIKTKILIDAAEKEWQQTQAEIARLKELVRELAYELGASANYYFSKKAKVILSRPEVREIMEGK